MEYIDESQLPNDKDGSKFFLLNGKSDLPFDGPNLNLLSFNGKRLVEQFFETKGSFLGGGVMKSADFENEAKQIPSALKINQQLKMQISSMPAREVIKMSSALTSEWIAFEYSVVFSITMYGYLPTIKWDDFDQIAIKKMGLMGTQSTAELNFRDHGNSQKIRFEANTSNIKNFGLIAASCGVHVR